MKTIYLICSKEYINDYDEYELSPEFAVGDEQVANKLSEFISIKDKILEKMNTISEPEYQETLSYKTIKGTNLTEVEKIVIKAENKKINEHNNNVFEINRKLKKEYEEKVYQEENRVVNEWFKENKIPEGFINRIIYFNKDFEIKEITLY